MNTFLFPPNQPLSGAFFTLGFQWEKGSSILRAVHFSTQSSTILPLENSSHPSPRPHLPHMVYQSGAQLFTNSPSIVVPHFQSLHRSSPIPNSRWIEFVLLGKIVYFPFYSFLVPPKVSLALDKQARFFLCHLPFGYHHPSHDFSLKNREIPCGWTMRSSSFIYSPADVFHPQIFENLEIGQGTMSF